MTPEPTIRRAESPSRRRNTNASISAMSTASSTASSSACPASRTSLAPVLLLLLVGCLTYGPQYSHGYNIDLPSYIRHTREPNTMFGFSIALHRGKGGYPLMNSLIVGAPKYDTSAYQQGVLEAGAVFKCGMDDGDCSLVRFDSTGNRHNSNGDVIERKSHQWLGATISTSRDNDLVVACAPRFVFHTMTPTKTLRYDPVGTCFTSRNFTQFKEISPCRTSYWGYHRQGSCQAGFSAAASKTGDRLYIGAPGSWYWQGEAYSVSSDATFPYKPSFYQPFGTGGQSYSYDVTRPENQVFSTTESSSQDDDSYLGYSMVTGDFNGDGMDDIAIGMPRGAGLLGKIVVNGWNMANIFNITGRQIGEYFGYALASSDVDGDGLDDLIIGAPMFSEPGNAEGKYDVGRIYVLLQKSTNKANRWTEEFIRDGYNTKGRFGLSLASLGDINRDGYGDFAVGAPYDGPEGRGAVYIFHGSVNGPLQKPSQIIRSEDLIEGAPYPRTFGFSLSGGLDMDGNTYPDLAVGAYASDQVFIFKSRPVAAVNAVTNFINPSKLINLEEKQCQTVRDGKRVSCTDITTCWSYTGEYLPRNLEFDVSWVLDAKKPKNPRMFFILDEGKNIRNQSVSLDYGKTYCRNETVYLIDNLQDKLTPLEVEMRYNLRSSRRLSPVVRRRRETLDPVIDQNREIILRDAINIQKNCGLDNICEPDLRLEIKTVDKYLLGSREPLSIEVLISNFNEDAFEAAFYLVMPKDLDFKKIQQIGDKGDTPITCSAPSEANNNTLKCDIGNPLQRGKVANFNVVMSPSHKVGMAPSYDFFMEANSTNIEKLGSHFDNIIRKSIGIWVETDLAIEGTSLPDFQFYKASDYKAVENASKEEDLGPQVVHIYNIRNNGPSAIEEAVVLIHYPYQTVSGDLLMYLTNQPETDGRIRCDPHVAVNSRNLHLDRTLKDKSYLEQIGAVVRTGGVSSASSYRGVRIEQSQGVGGGGTVIFLNETKELSAEEEKRLHKEDEQDVSGDASFIHSQRANAAAAAEASTHSASGGHASGSNGSWTWSSSWNSSTDGRAPSVVVSSKNTSVYYDSRGQPHVVESSTEYVKALDRSSSYHGESSNYVAADHNTGHLNAGVLNIPAVQKQQQPQAAHNARGHIQMANPDGSGSYQQSYANYGNPGGSSGGAYRPHLEYNNANRVAGSGSVNIEKAAQGGHGFQAGMLDLGTLNRGNVNSEGGSAGSSGTAYRPQVQYNNANRVAGGGSLSLEKTAQGGHGFQAGMLDLGTLNRDNVDNELRDRGSQSYHEFHSSRPQGGASYHTSYSSSGGAGGSSASSSKPYYGMENEDYYDEDGQQVAPQPQRTRTSSSTSHRRFRRASETTEELSPLGSPCKAAKCETIRCVATNLGKDDGVWVAIRTRMVAKTMEKLASNVPVNVSTMAVSYVTRLPYIGEPKDEIIKSHEIFFKAEPEPVPVPDVVPLWVVVLAACAGALILLLLVFLLYKCGFFNRNRPTDHSQERQPLRNGYHGDEHL